MKYYLTVLLKYAIFSGRSRRSEYWFFFLFNSIFGVVANVLDILFGIAIDGLCFGLIYIIYVLAVFLPATAVAVRRLHDVGKSGWIFFVILIPFIGIIWLITMLCKDSQQGHNKWGRNPKEVYTF